MAKSNEPDGGPVPKWMRLLVEKWRVADQAAAYPVAVPPKPAATRPDAPVADPPPPPSSDQN